MTRGAPGWTSSSAEHGAPASARVEALAARSRITSVSWRPSSPSWARSADPAAFVAAAKRMPGRPSSTAVAPTEARAGHRHGDANRVEATTRAWRAMGSAPVPTPTPADAADYRRRRTPRPKAKARRGAATAGGGRGFHRQPPGRAPARSWTSASPVERSVARRRRALAANGERDLDRRHRQGAGQLRRDHQLQAGAGARRGRARRDAVARARRASSSTAPATRPTSTWSLPCRAWRAPRPRSRTATEAGRHPRSRALDAHFGRWTRVIHSPARR